MLKVCLLILYAPDLLFAYQTRHLEEKRRMQYSYRYDDSPKKKFMPCNLKTQFAKQICNLKDASVSIYIPTS